MLLIENKALRQAFGALETANFLYLKLLLKNPKNLRWFPGRIFRSYMRLAGEDRWPCRGVFEEFAAPEGQRFTVEYVPHGDGLGERLDWLAYLAYIAKATAPRRVFEIGTFRGRTTLNFALNTPDDAEIFTLDLSPEERRRMAKDVSEEDRRLIELDETGIDYKGKDVASKIVQLWGNSLTFDFSPWKGSIDLVFVDAAHHYDAVRSDTAAALEMVKPGGLIIWDNFSQYGDYNDVTRAVLDHVGAERIVQIEDTELAIHRTSSAAL
jgi:predicted O-methyltransferase YrrM